MLARFLRVNGNNVLFVSGTDAHGTSIVMEALRKGKGVEELLKVWHNMHKSMCKSFNISFDVFGTTHSYKHSKNVLKITRALIKEGVIRRGEEEIPYCTHFSI